jgi:hypothetical protein
MNTPTATTPVGGSLTRLVRTFSDEERAGIEVSVRIGRLRVGVLHGHLPTLWHRLRPESLVDPEMFPVGAWHWRLWRLAIGYCPNK